jgi:hypothetical protein
MSQVRFAASLIWTEACYSCLSATIGSTRTARRAGIKQARTAIATMTEVTIRNVVGS